MGASPSKAHWETIYSQKQVDKVSWYQEHADTSLRFIASTRVGRDARIIDVGGGASVLVDDLLAEGYQHITVLDISGAALRSAQERLGALAAAVTWLEADITRVTLPVAEYDVWHDRAVFHFLTNARERELYLRAVMQSVKPRGHVVVATFAPDGPPRCSGLETARYNADQLHAEFGPAFQLVDSLRELHHTPFGSEQAFVYCYCRKR